MRTRTPALRRTGFALALLALAGCADVPATPASAGSSDGALDAAQVGHGIAQSWIDAWNSADLDALAQLHDRDLIYYWRGAPRGYDEFMEELRLFVFPDGEAPEEGDEIRDVRVQEMTPNVLVVGFQLHPGGTEAPGAAVTLVVAQRAAEWKVTHIHESPVR